MICDQCMAEIRREFSKGKGKSVNCLAYGCDTFNKYGRTCDRIDIIRECIKLFKLQYEEFGDKKIDNQEKRGILASGQSK